MTQWSTLRKSPERTKNTLPFKAWSINIWDCSLYYMLRLDPVCTRGVNKEITGGLWGVLSNKRRDPWQHERMPQSLWQMRKDAQDCTWHCLKLGAPRVPGIAKHINYSDVSTHQNVCSYEVKKGGMVFWSCGLGGVSYRNRKGNSSPTFSILVVWLVVLCFPKLWDTNI